MDKKVVELSNMIEEKARNEAECFPVDRAFLQKYLNFILSLDRDEFLLCNLERGSNTYTVQLFLCLPELWEDISIDNLKGIIRRFSNVFSYYTLIEFTHKYIEINIIEVILNMPLVPKEIKNNIVNYLATSLYLNLVKTDGDRFFFKEGVYGVDENSWIYIKQRLLLDERVQPALTSVDEVARYVKALKYQIK